MSWVRDLQERVRRAGADAQSALQPRVAQAKRSLEEGLDTLKGRGRELYADDASLAASLAALDAVRTHIRSLSGTVETQRAQLLACAQTQRLLGDQLAAPAPLGLPASRATAQSAFAQAQTQTAASLARFALDMSTPMADLSRTFEERYTASVAPLKRAHASAKQEHLRAVRAARAASEDPARREHLEAAAAEALAPAQRASEALQGEIRALLAHATTVLSEWALNVAQAQAETYARAAEAFANPSKLAQQAQDATQ